MISANFDDIVQSFRFYTFDIKSYILSTFSY